MAEKKLTKSQERQIDRLRGNPNELMERALRFLILADEALNEEGLTIPLAYWEAAQANANVAEAMVKVEQRSE